MKEKTIVAAAWILSALAGLLAVFVWATSFAWHFSNLSIYQVFPVLGLLAFSIMWSHYLAGLVRRLTGTAPQALASYFRLTGYVVLVAICLHPGLLIYQLFRDGMGFPPGSYERYVAPGLGWITLIGTTSLFIFLAYEFKRFFGGRSWWKFVDYATDLAMLGIFYHGLKLGSQLQSGPFRYVWYFYGLTLVIAIIHKYTWRGRLTP